MELKMENLLLPTAEKAEIINWQTKSREAKHECSPKA